MSIRIKYGNPLDLERAMRERQMSLEDDRAPSLDDLNQTISRARNRQPKSVRNPLPSERLRQRAVSRNRRQRELENEGRVAQRERLANNRSRRGGLVDPRTDQYLDDRNFYRDMFELDLKDRQERDSYFRGQNGELMGDLFDPERDDPGEGWDYTEAQRQELQRIAETANSLASDPTLTEEERYRGLVQLQNKRDLVRPNKKQAPPPDPEEMWSQQVHEVRDPETGEFMGFAGVDRSGNFRMVADAKKAERPEDNTLEVRKSEREDEKFRYEQEQEKVKFEFDRRVAYSKAHQNNMKVAFDLVKNSSVADGEGSTVVDMAKVRQLADEMTREQFGDMMGGEPPQEPEVLPEALEDPESFIEQVSAQYPDGIPDELAESVKAAIKASGLEQLY